MKDVENWDSLSIISENVICKFPKCHFVKQLSSSFKFKHILIMGPKNCTSMYLHKVNENSMYIQKPVWECFQYHQKLETFQMSLNWRINNQSGSSTQWNVTQQ